MKTMASSTENLTAGSVHEYNTDNEDNKKPRTKSAVKSPKLQRISSPGGLNGKITWEIQEEIDNLLENVPQVGQTFEILNKIGSGTFSSVFAARIKNRPEIKRIFALKHIIPTSHPSRIENELRCLQLVGGRDNVMGVEACLRERDHVVIVMPFFHHDKFQDYILDLSVEEVRDYMFNLMIALKRVHDVNIIHRDVKPSNFLLNRKHKKYALVDFGLAQQMDGKTTEETHGKASDAPPSSSIDPKKRKNDLEDNSVPASKRTRLSSPLQMTRAADIYNNSRPKSCGDARRPDEASLRRAILSKNAQSNAKMAVRQRTMIVQNRHGQQLYKSVRPASCRCYGEFSVCGICISRSNQNAPRAGTPGFRAPEVLMKCPHQGTGLDMWSAGVIFLSLLSGRYPFFKASDDLTALAQIISVFGTNAIQKAALTYGKNVNTRPHQPPMDLRDLCQRLHPQGSKIPSGSSKCSSSAQSASTVEFPASAFDLLKRLLDLNPSTRITAQDAIKHPFFTGCSYSCPV